MSCWCNAPNQVTMLLGFTQAQLGQLVESDMVMSQHCFLLTVASILTTMKDGVPEQLCNTDPKGSGPEQRKLWIFDTNDHVALDGIFHDLSCQKKDSSNRLGYYRHEVVLVHYVYVSVSSTVHDLQCHRVALKTLPPLVGFSTNLPAFTTSFGCEVYYAHRSYTASRPNMVNTER